MYKVSTPVGVEHGFKGLINVPPYKYHTGIIPENDVNTFGK